MTPSKNDKFSKTLKANFKRFKSNGNAAIKWNVLAPKHSMAWEDLKRGKIITADRMRRVNLPSTVCRMIANDARNRTIVESAPPLMSLNLPPPSFNHPLPTFNNNSQIDAMNFQTQKPHDEKRILDVLTRINTIFLKISQALNISLCACVERRKSDNSMCLFTYFHGFPWAIMGGMVTIEEKDINKPPEPQVIYEAWRNQFFQSLEALIPPPIFIKMKRCVDQGVDMEWCIKVASSDDVREVLRRIAITKMNPMYSILWTTKPMDYDPRNQEFSNARSVLIRQVEAEVKVFWTYERIGLHLKMYFNSVN